MEIHEDLLNLYFEKYKKTMGKVVIVSAPSGSGKTTVVNHLLEAFDCFAFSVSATTRAPRGVEKNGEAYHFISVEEFQRRIREKQFVEFEQVYNGVYYGTLKSEVERIWEMSKVILFDVDVRGGVNLKKYFGDEALSIFVKAPSIKEIRRRLENRGTDSQAFIDERVKKARIEMMYQPKFDYILVNDDLQTCLAEADRVIGEFLEK